MRDVEKRFASFVAVEGLDLDIEDGEFVSLLGPSGCGKTTTLRMVAGFIDPDAGDIFFGDKRMNDVPPNRRNTAMVFQSYALFPHMTVAQNVGFGLRMQGLARDVQQRRIAEALEMVSLTGLEKRRPSALSGGQQQRVALARAVATRPDVLLFDEPLSNLDARLREKVGVEIRDLQRRLKITSLYVTHDQAEALAISDHVVVMNKGRIEQAGDPDAIYRRPASAFVADFVGAANLLDGRSLGGSRVETALGIFTLADSVAAAGEAVKLCWRPEDMRLGDGEPLNQIKARVTNIAFRGAFVDLTLKVADISFRAQLPNDTAAAIGEDFDLHAVTGVDPDGETLMTRASSLTTAALLLPGAGFIAVFLIAAVGMTVLQSIGLYPVVGASRLTLDFWAGLFNKTFLDSLLFSLRVGFGSAIGALIFSYPLALFLRRRRFASDAINAIAKIPLFVPALVAAFLILNMLAFNGLLNNALIYLGLIDRPLRLLNDRFGWGVLVIEVWKNLPFQLVILTSVLQTVRLDLEDAARNLGANPLQVIYHIILPLSVPGIMISVALVFILTFGDYAVTQLAGPIYPNSLSVLMYTTAFTLHDWGTAACIGVVIMVTSLLFVALYVRTVRAIGELSR